VKFSALFSNTPAKLIAALFLVIFLTAAPCARAQETQAGAATTTTAPTETEAVQRRLARARALAAIGKLAAAASELEALRSATREDAVRDVARVLLVSIYVEMPDYARAAALLEETFKARTAGRADDAATSAYFALAGQTINSVRQHLDRYRAFGLNVADQDLPSEANSDLDQLRGLLERVVEHAKAVGAERGGAATPGADATALLEDAATVRMRIARHGSDRSKWQSEVSAARQLLFASETRIASISSIPAASQAANRTASTTTPTSAPQNPAAAQPARPQPAREERATNAQQNVRASAPAPKTPAATPEREAAKDAPAAGSESAATGLVSVGSLNALARQRVTPSYPQIARAARVSGVVTVYMVVNEKGDVASIERAEGPLQLQQAASEAARRWKFNPMVINGQPVRITGYLSFNFAL
jgi:TonB family protein